MSISEAATSEAAETTLVTLSDIEAAAERISDLVLRTPIIPLPHPQRLWPLRAQNGFLRWSDWSDDAVSGRE